MSQSPRTIDTATSAGSAHAVVGSQCHDPYPAPAPAPVAPRGRASDEVPDRGRDQVEVSVSPSPARTVTVTGHLGLGAEERLASAVRATHVAAPLIIDLTAATLDPTGVAALMAACVGATQREQRVVVVVPGAPERAALYDLGMTRILRLATSTDEALEWLVADASGRPV